MPYHTHAQQLIALQNQALESSHRIAVVLAGTVQWQQQVLQQLGELHHYQGALILGERSLSYAQTVSFKQARQKLGQESDLIIADLNAPFDANGFTAVSGTLKGGSLLVILPNTQPSTHSQLWLEKACQAFIRIEQASTRGFEVNAIESIASSFSDTSDGSNRFLQQTQVIDAIHKVLTGHRKRPLVITADRGRGKSAALGIAAGQIIKESNKTVLVTAPSTQAVKTLFEHAAKQLGTAPQKGYTLSTNGGGTLRFIAPDELLRENPNCDLLLIDEAAAIPLPLLQSIVERYHRTCFATTVHGYEGCGRGFSIKFSAWLNQHRVGWKSLKLTQPIRWNAEDPVEAWLFDTFLLDAEVESFALSDYSNATLTLIEVDATTECIAALRKAFGLLVNAHYQTSPNDVFQLLDDRNVCLYQVLLEGDVAGVILGYREGGLSEAQLQDIQLGRRRPAGHLVPVSMVAQLANNEPATDLSLRVMRIAVHPQLQGKGMGSWMLSQLESLQGNEVAYLSTSFGVTGELFNFWRSNDFDAVRLGSKQDQASGCFSVTMVKPLYSRLAWREEAKTQLVISLLDTASDIHLNLATEVLVALLVDAPSTTEVLSERLQKLVSNYVQGGSSFEATRAIVQQLLLAKLTSAKDYVAGDDLSHFGLREYDSIYVIAELSIKKLSWAALCQQYGFTGRKQAEAHYRQAITALTPISL
ncbi:tRNA(Met) cytidine acetyltransferase TmcA [Vibrio neonatus]|uniref:tRNA(Met) cytidine acetyltransferase TmcA n=1 Tax=Vibrio neonatus TaxID=278860 RepID=UPI0021C49ED8|nr:GNAT family N-acetyltransferase [Vibrio neonatus]